MPDPRPNIAEKRRILQLETLYDLALTLHGQRAEQELVDELLERVCAVLDPAAAVAVTRDPYGGPRGVATVGWLESPPSGTSLLSSPLWRELLTEGRLLARARGELAGRAYGELLATPLAYRGVYLGYVAVLDKEVRGDSDSSFTADDRRFLDSVAALAGVALDSARQVERLETQRERLAEENKALKGRLADEIAGQRIVATAPAMRQVLDMVERVAPRSVNVLVRGESGTGKELVAKLLHLLSRREGSLIALNIAALPESLLESELFGIEGGVATGVQARPGKFELADGGTLFLDEIGDMETSLQVRLLRVLQEREVVRLGGRQPIPVDVRLVAATHQDLEKLVAEGRFREDLYYRLKGVERPAPAAPRAAPGHPPPGARLRRGLQPARGHRRPRLPLGRPGPPHGPRLPRQRPRAAEPGRGRRLARRRGGRRRPRALADGGRHPVLPRAPGPGGHGAAAHLQGFEAYQQQQERGGEDPRDRPQDLTAEGVLGRTVITVGKKLRLGPSTLLS